MGWGVVGWDVMGRDVERLWSDRSQARTYETIVERNHGGVRTASRHVTSLAQTLPVHRSRIKSLCVGQVGNGMSQPELRDEFGTRIAWWLPQE